MEVNRREGMDWINLVRLLVAGTCVIFRIKKNGEIIGQDNDYQFLKNISDSYN
jgi:hypothetical protein